MLLMLVSCVSMIWSVWCIVIVLGRRVRWCIASSMPRFGPSSNERLSGSASLWIQRRGFLKRWHNAPWGIGAIAGCQSFLWPSLAIKAFVLPMAPKRPDQG